MNARETLDATIAELAPFTASDWLLTEVEDKGPGHYYRYRVTGRNVNSLRGEYGHWFSWSVPDISDKRYHVTDSIIAHAIIVLADPKLRAAKEALAIAYPRRS